MFITETVFTARYEMGFVLSLKGSGIVLKIVQWIWSLDFTFIQLRLEDYEQIQAS